MMFYRHVSSGIALALIWLLVQTKSSGSLSIARGENDSVWFDKDYLYDEMVNYTDDTTLDCNKKTKICQCKASDGYRTLIYNNNTKQVKCVKDESNVFGIIRHDGMYLKTKNGRCLTAGESDGKIHAAECIGNDLSNQWLLVAVSQLLNLRTLKCLRRSKDSPELTTEQCKSDEDMQQWKPKPIGVDWLMINHTLFETGPFSHHRYHSLSYKGCYRISKNKFIGVVKKSPRCKRTSQKECSTPITINAPVFYEEISTCNIIWENSTYSKYGQVWNSFPTSAENLFILKNVNHECINLTVSNMNLFERWSGTLIKLNIECGTANKNYVILKIQSSRRKSETPTIASPTSSVVTSSLTSYSTSSPIKKNKMSSLLFVIPVVVLLCFVIAAIIVVYCRRRRKRINSKKENHVYEETTANNEMIGYEDPAQITEMQRLGPNTYESPGLTISAGNHYEYPTNGPTPQNSLTNPRNNNNFQYDYATREETSLLPLILGGDVILEDDASGNADNASGTPKKRGKRDVPQETPQEKPLYHTLEEDTSDLPHPREEPDTRTGHSVDQPLYHTLENGNENVHQTDSQ